MEFTRIKSGQKYSEEALANYGLIKSPLIIAGVYKLTPRLDLSAQTSGVINNGTADASRVYEVREAHPRIQVVSAEFSASQTGTQILAAPGAGKKYVITYAAISTDSTSGVAYFHGGTITAALKLYFSAQTRGDASGVEREWPENTAILFTSTQGAKNLYYSLQYYIADV